MPTSNPPHSASRLTRFSRGLKGRLIASTRYARQRFTGRRHSPYTRGQLGLLSKYRVANLITDSAGRVPVRWWDVADNFGDLLSPWLIEKLSGRETVFADRKKPHYVVVGSIAGRARDNSVVWGTGSFGTEGEDEIAAGADYRAVRGPLTRSRIQHFGADVPAVYGDPALLSPLVFNPSVEPEYEVGVVLRWSERARQGADFGDGVLAINLETTDIEGTIEAFLKCKRIVTSSLHGLIIADAYGIPNAWIASKTPKGGEFKYYDYFATVGKFRTVQRFGMTRKPVTVKRVLRSLVFDGRPIKFDVKALLDANPFLERKA
ncbi:hypothetical protein GCM10010401_11620 [Rarobacter faecitabidus]|uniref:Pyruvyl transferase n=1 Tax=Rarobacter faecitabidus TaxID=13243 RepID=A0A542ZPG3_RARFA|nr:polysaccharide pyruvyl transferase family protein [Rarobacter faecitabidus]TQL62100.1 pyruvyl transferase [Rarobacter faecitabidus]